MTILNCKVNQISFVKILGVFRKENKSGFQCKVNQNSYVKILEDLLLIFWWRWEKKEKKRQIKTKTKKKMKNN